jgi:hypothetical protein
MPSANAMGASSSDDSRIRNFGKIFERIVKEISSGPEPGLGKGIITR